MTGRHWIEGAAGVYLFSAELRGDPFVIEKPTDACASWRLQTITHMYNFQPLDYPTLEAAKVAYLLHLAIHTP